MKITSNSAEYVFQKFTFIELLVVMAILAAMQLPEP